MPELVISPMQVAVGRKKINGEQMPARLPVGTIARMDAVLDDAENRSDFLRVAVEKELSRREKHKPPRKGRLNA